MSAEFPLHRGRAWLGVAASLAFGVLCLVTAPFGGGLWTIFGAVFGLGCLAAALYGLRLLFRKGPVLVISAEGLTYAPFANRPAPWNEITAMTRILSFGRMQVLGRVTWTRAPSADQLNFALADYRAYPNGVFRALSRTLQHMGGLPPISIQLGIADGDGDAIIAEIKKYWTGHIAEYDPRPADQR